MSRAYKINIVNSVVFIGCGMGGFIGRYLSNADFQPTAMIPFVLGLLLLVMTPGMKGENKVIILAAIVLTLIFGIVICSMLVGELVNAEVSPRKIAVFAVITVSSLISLILYFLQYLSYNKEKESKGA